MIWLLKLVVERSDVVELASIILRITLMIFRSVIKNYDSSIEDWVTFFYILFGVGWVGWVGWRTHLTCVYVEQH